MNNLSCARSEPIFQADTHSVTKPLKIVFWGLGSIGARLARLIKAHFPHELYAWRHQPNGSNPLGIREIKDDQELKDLAPQVAFIANPTSLHLETALRCAERGMDLFIEKPLSHQLLSIEKLQSLIKTKGLISFIACPLRFDPVLLSLREQIRTEEVLYSRIICSSYLPNWRPGQDYRRLYSAQKHLGGGVLLDLIHELDYAAWLLGPIEGIEGRAGKISDLELNTEDFADLLVKHLNGTNTSIHLDYFGIVPQRKIEIIGNRFYFEANLIDRSIISNKDDIKNVTRFSAFDRDAMCLEQLKYFFSCLDLRIRPCNDIEDHLALLTPLLFFKTKLGL